MSCPREKRQAAEHGFIGPYGVLSENSKGRPEPEAECDIRTCFQRDVDRITHSKAFRRLKHKTQVYLQPEATITVQGSHTPWRFPALHARLQGRSS